MLGDDIAKLMFRLLTVIPKLIGFLLRVIIFLGVYWFLVASAPAIIYEFVTKGNAFDNAAIKVITDILMVVALVLAVITTIQSLVRVARKDQSFNIYAAMFGLVQRKKQGFIAPINDKEKKVSATGAKTVQGFVFGKLKGKYIVKDEQTDGHILVIGGAGSGKTSCIAIPTLMSWRHRVFVIDIKGELFEKTHAARNAARIKVFNPTDKAAYNYDPYYMLRHTDDISSEARELSLSICPLAADVKDPFWVKSAQNMLSGFILYFFGMGLNFAETMLEIKSKPVKELVTEIMESGDRAAIIEVSQFAGMDDKTLSGIFTELSNHITIFATNSDLQRALSGKGDCITPADLESGYDVFCSIPEHKLEQWKDLFGMMCNQFLKAFERRPEGNKDPILFLIDEFPRLGKIESISNGLATLRSKKIHIALFVQSKSQLNAIYGKDIAEVIADNCTYKAILKASEPNTQEWCSKLVGTFDKTKLSSNYNADIIGVGKGQGTSKTTEEKKIIKPEEFAYLNDIVCIFPTGYQRIEKAPYYQEKVFASSSR